SRAGTVRDDAGSLGGYLNLTHTSSGLWADIVALGTRHSMKASTDNNDFRARGDMSMGTAAAGSNMTFSPSRNGTSLDLQAGLEARVRENITLGVQAGYAHSVSGSSAEGYNGQATLNVTF
ncbi:autotransporter outer membrane beta-barrel domain-containing protein, partial [Escherichia coli]